MYGNTSDNSDDETSATKRSASEHSAPAQQQVITETKIARQLEPLPQIADTNTAEASNKAHSVEKPKDIDSAIPEEPQAYVEEMKRPFTFNQDNAPILGKEQVASKAHDVPFPSECQGASAQEKNHLSIACHLFPRLSETNLQFHDISWNYEQSPDGKQRAILRKRMVKVCVLLKITSIRYEKRPVESEIAPIEFLVELALVDGRPRAENQIVSNLHTLKISLQTTRIGFLKTLPACSVIVRSNYAQPEVRLRITLHKCDNITQNKTESLGSVELRLLDSTGRAAWRADQPPPRFHLFGNFRMNFEFCEFSTRQLQMQADYLPDVLICDESWMGLLTCYRQMLCEIIVNSLEDHPPSKILNDVVLAMFPRIFTNHSLVDGFTKLLIKEKVLTSAESLTDGSQPISAQKINTFRRVFKNSILPILMRVPDARDSKSLTPSEGDPLAIFGAQRCAPLSVSDFALHLSGAHALD